MLNITPSSQQDRELIYLKTLLNNTDKVTKVVDHGVLSAHAKAISKIAGKAEKDMIIALSQLFPDNSAGDILDTCATIFGISPRFSACESSTYLRLVGDAGTTYSTGINVFNSKDGIQFQLEQDVVIGSFGFAYAKVRSVDSGDKTNVDAGKIDKVAPEPVGHLYCNNEYRCSGGQDQESDSMFQQRIKGGSNILATGTIAMIEQAFMKINSNVLRVFYQGLNEKGQIKLALVSQNGIDFSSAELDSLLTRGSQFFGLSQLKSFGSQSYGIKLSNINWQPIDLDFRVQLYDDVDVDSWRKDVSINLSKYLDFKSWRSGVQFVDFVNLIETVRTVNGTKACPDNYFYPNKDIQTDKNKLPRLRGLIIRNLSGSIISGNTNQFNPVYYPATVNESLQQNLLTSI